MTAAALCEHPMVLPDGRCRFCGASRATVASDANNRHYSVLPSPALPAMMTLPRTVPPAGITSIPRAAPYIVWHGRQLLRTKGFIRPPTRMTCPDLHPVKKNAIVREDGAVWCTYRSAAGQGECGAMLYVLSFPALGGKRRVWASDVTKAELDEMESLGLDADGALAYFGAGFTR